MLFIGQTRFSLFEPGSRAWRLTRGSSEDDESVESYRENLFSESRMRGRSEIFFGHTLPTLDAGRQNFELIHVVSYSEELPRQYKRMLYDAEREYSWLRLDLRTDANRKGDPIGLAKNVAGKGVAYGHYRLDDDDILSTSYFQQMEKYVASPFVGMRVSLALGVVAELESGRLVNPREIREVNASQGLLEVNRFDERGKLESPKRISHTKSDRVSPVILDSREISHVRVLHESQDTQIGRRAAVRDRRGKLSGLPLVKESVDLGKLFPVTEFAERG